jgi:hypothetical protein
MDSANKEHQALFQISMMYYHLYPVMLIAGFPVVKPADMYEVAHPFVWAALLDYVLFIFNKTAEGKDLNIKYFSQEFQNISEEVYSGFRQIVAAAKPHEIFDIYRDAFVETEETEAMVGGGDGDLFSAMFPGQSGGGGAGGPNGSSTAIATGVAGPTTEAQQRGAITSTAIATGVAGSTTEAQQRGAITARFAEKKMERLGYLASFESMNRVRTELQKLVDDIKGDINYVNEVPGAKLSTFGKQLKAAIDKSIEATTMGSLLKKEADSLSPCWGPCGMVCDTFTNKFVTPAAVLGTYIVSQTDNLDSVKKMLGLMPAAATGWQWGDLGYLVSAPTSWVTGAFSGTVGALGSGIVSGITGLRLSFPCLAGSVACICATKVCCDTTREFIKTSKSISRTKAAELLLLNKVKNDVLSAALSNIERELKAYVTYAHSLSVTHPAEYIESVMDEPIDENNTNYKQKLKNIEKSKLNEKTKEKEKITLIFHEQAKHYARKTMDSLFEKWKEFPMLRIRAIIDDDKKKGYDILLEDIDSKNKALAKEIAKFHVALEGIAGAPGAALATGARVAGLGVVNAAAMGIAAVVPQVAPALLGTATGFDSLTHLGAETAESAATGLAHTFVGTIQDTRRMLASASAAPTQQFMLGAPQPTRLAIGPIPTMSNELTARLRLTNAPIPQLTNGSVGGRRTIRLKNRSRRSRRSRRSHRSRRSNRR